MLKTEKLKEPSRLFRASVARGAKAIDRDGGEYGAGVIRGASVIARGEALGHGMWIDKVMLSQVHEAINSVDSGVKGRFTHPGMSGDGLGKGLGRWQNASVSGDKVTADLHFYESAHATPDGDLADYVMKLAEEDPAAFGVSIAFTPDYGAEELFAAENKDKKGNFISPDPDNKENLFHVRLADLAAGDVVDEPAANPDGLFHRGNELLEFTDSLLDYVFLGGTAPDTLTFGGIAPERIRDFAQRWLDRHNLSLMEEVEIETDDGPTWRQRAVGLAVMMDGEK